MYVGLRCDQFGPHGCWRQCPSTVQRYRYLRRDEPPRGSRDCGSGRRNSIMETAAGFPAAEPPRLVDVGSDSTRVSATVRCSISSQVAPRIDTNSEVSGLPWTSSVRGTVGLTSSVVPDHSGDRTPKAASRSCLFGQSRRHLDLQHTVRCADRHQAASHGTSPGPARPNGCDRQPGSAQHRRPASAGECQPLASHSLSSPNYSDVRLR